MRSSFLLLSLLLLQLSCFAKGSDKTSMSNQKLSFLENKGQVSDQNGNTRPDVQFSISSPGMTVFIGQGQLHYQFSKSAAKQIDDPATAAFIKKLGLPAARQLSTYRMDVKLEGANMTAGFTTEGRQSELTNYYITNDKDGITGVGSFRKITYRNIYPGIDWILYTDGTGLKYDFIVHPGANINDIQLSYNGASSLEITKAGDLRAVTPYGAIEEQRPYAYQESDRKEIASSFVLNGNTLSFATDAYNGALVVDPGVEWGTYFGDGTETNTGTSCDTAGFVYLAGMTTSPNNIATSGAFQQTFSGSFGDGFVAKFDSTGSRIWSTYYGGMSATSLYPVTRVNIACDKTGMIYIAGSTTAESGIASPGSFQSTIAPGNIPFFGGSWDAFLVQFDGNGIRNWGTYFGGAGLETFNSLAFDKDGNIYAGGLADTAGMLSTPGAHQTVPSPTTSMYGEFDGILAKFNSGGTRLWCTYYGGVERDEIISVSIDTSENVFAGGITMSPDNIATPGTWQTALMGSSCSFLAKFDVDGDREWATYIPETLNDMTCDVFDHIYITGITQSPAGSGVSTPGAYSEFYYGSYDYFLMSLNKDGWRNWGTYYGGPGMETGTNRVICDAAGYVYITGTTESANDVPLNGMATPGSHQDTLAGVSDAFVAQFDSLGNRHWASYFGGTGDEQFAVYTALDKSGAMYISSTTTSPDQIATPGTYQTAIAGASDAFLIRLLPVDLTVASLVAPADDTVCTGKVPLALLLKNNGRLKANDTIFISCSYSSASSSGTLDTFYTLGLNAGATATISFDSLDLTAGTYTLQSFISYSRDDSSRGNDTLAASFTVVDCTTGITTIAGTQDGVLVYPNPAAQRLFIRSAHAPEAYSILNSVGQTVANGGVARQTGIDISMLPEGYYLLRLNVNGATIAKPFQILR